MKNLKITLLSFILVIFVTPSIAAVSNKSDRADQLVKQINPAFMWQTLTRLTQFPDRSSSHRTGVVASVWIQQTLNRLIKASGRHDTSIFFVETRGIDIERNNTPFYSSQPSMVLKIGTSNEPGIVVGSHYDTMECATEGCINETGYPGADDDGSGTSVLIELAHVLLDSQMKFNKPIYLIWYAAEEKGAWGSQAVVNYFMQQHIPVDIIMQLDQMGYAMNNESALYLESDHFLKPGEHPHIDPDATNAFQQIAESYMKKSVKFSCAGNSDNRSWVDIAHVKAIRPLESDYCINGSKNNPNVHTTTDTPDTLSLDHMVDYLKMAILFVDIYAD